MSHTFDAVVNFRDLGGHDTRDGARIRTGQVFRSAHFGQATDADLGRLGALGIRLVVDFRNAADIAEEGHNRLPNGCEVVGLPIGDETQSSVSRRFLYEASPDQIAQRYGNDGARAAMRQGMTMFATDERHRAVFGRLVTLLAEADAPAVFHCSAGKDRTGWGAAVVLLALGVDEEHILTDYLRSNDHQPDRSARLDQFAKAGVDPEIMRPFFGVEASFLRAGLDAMHEWCGGDVDRYLTDGLGVAPGALARLRERMLER